MPEAALKDLDPAWTDHGLMFQCPACPDGHYVMPQFWGEPLYPSKAIWRLTAGCKGAPFENVSVEPSINCTVKPDGGPTGCGFHGWVTNGRVLW